MGKYERVWIAFLIGVVICSVVVFYAQWSQEDPDKAFIHAYDESFDELEPYSVEFLERVTALEISDAATVAKQDLIPIYDKYINRVKGIPVSSKYVKLKDEYMAYLTDMRKGYNIFASFEGDSSANVLLFGEDRVEKCYGYIDDGMKHKRNCEYIRDHMYERTS